ncbi:DUF4301 family protein [Planktosalinus lacus]|uniref:DUF4301 domain-containing protein n=1 Tax=Planktosalinus lacus TaxID=1526573 RepID=A0A8J2YB29_9FLAO|nr:DUF4301 family protein [Planktosalinus lacus]GGD96060.1 hypothetical protein GCM10011312_19540 [Planktosalinus lacus]
MKFTKKDNIQIQQHGLTEAKVLKDLKRFENGIPFIHLISAATHSNGILCFSQKEKEHLIKLYDKRKDNLTIVKFVPASGAATRMFKHLHYFVETYKPDEQKFNNYLAENDTQLLEDFLKGLPHFAFTKKLRKKLRKLYPEFKFYKKGKRIHLLVKTLLKEDGLNYSKLPKGLVPFHKYKKNTATAFEEQLLETGFYASTQGQCYIHFTFAETFVEHFKKEFLKVKKRVERKTKSNLNISYSFQKPSTDTIATTLKNTPYRDTDKNLHFRPAGHGALLENLNEMEADLLFIKNIDNVVTEEQLETVAIHKKILAGKLLEIQTKVFNYLKSIDKNPEKTSLLKDIRGFMASELNIKTLPETLDEAQKLLNRPIRVCGMVQNTGAPGGGPFWIKNQEGNISLQIVELSQVDKNDSHQMNIIQEATHFNPVDLVCGIKNYNGEKFDLTQFVNPETGFISHKSHQGKTIKALELPGLWNGSMAHWTTLFVEVPLLTFNPVKTVNDLLKETHQVV